MERENWGLQGASGFLPVHSTVQDQALLCPAAGEVLAGAGDGTQQLGTGPLAPCHHLLQPSGAADASQAPQHFPGSWVQLSFRQRHLWACSSSHQPQHHLCHPSLPLLQLLALHPPPAAVTMAFCLGRLGGIRGFCMLIAISTRLLSLHPSGICGLPREPGHP